MENFVNGKVNLPKSFWLYFFLINLILKQGTKILTSTYGQPPKFIGILLFLAITAYGFFSIVVTVAFLGPVNAALGAKSAND